MPDDVIDAIVEVLRDAASAHHRAFAHVDGADPDWPQWYAQYLAPRLTPLLRRTIDVNELTNELRRLDQEYHTRRGQQKWPEFYAHRLQSWQVQ
jgi:hypothetical protein